MASPLLITMPRAKGTQRLVGGWVEAPFSSLAWEIREDWDLVLSCLRSDSAAGSVLWTRDPAQEGTGCPDTILVGVGLFLRPPGFGSLESAQHLFWSCMFKAKPGPCSRKVHWPLLGVQGHRWSLLLIASLRTAEESPPHR